MWKRDIEVECASSYKRQRHVKGLASSTRRHTVRELGAATESGGEGHIPGATGTAVKRGVVEVRGAEVVPRALGVNESEIGVEQALPAALRALYTALREEIIPLLLDKCLGACEAAAR